MNNFIDEDTIRAEILDGLTQVDDSFKIDEFTCIFDSENRALSVRFTATNSSKESVEITEVWE